MNPNIFRILFLFHPEQTAMISIGTKIYFEE
jgi:hypothetical protein